MTPRLSLLLLLLCAVGCSAAPAGDSAAGNVAAGAEAKAPFASTAMGSFDEPWAMAFLPDGRLLVTEKKGKLKLLLPGGSSHEVTGVPAVDYGGQGGLGDVAVHPDFANNSLVYLSYAEAGEGDRRGAAIARARLVIDASGGGALSSLSVIWRQDPKVDGRGHYAHRMRFGQDGKLWVTSGDRQKFTPAQDMAANLGKVLRLNDDGTAATDNPFADAAGVGPQIYSLGHRNALGMAFDGQGRLWLAEMGPAGGDELNLVVRGRNYGWPLVSDGDHYDGADIPDHRTAPQYEAPKLTWTPVIAPGGLVIYSGDAFPAWKGDALIAGLAAQALVRVDISGAKAREAARYPMGRRIRDIGQAGDGSLWLLEDGAGGRLLRIDAVTPGN